MNRSAAPITVRPGWLWLCLLEFVVLGFGLLATTAGGYPLGDAGDFVVAWSLAGIGLLCTLFMVTHPRLVIAESGITIVKLFGVEVIGWDDISWVDPRLLGPDGQPQERGLCYGTGRPGEAQLRCVVRQTDPLGQCGRMDSSDGDFRSDFRRDQFNSLAFFYLIPEESERAFPRQTS